MNMRRFLSIVPALVFAALASLSCGKTPKPLDITGEWNLVNVQSRAAVVGEQTVDVYLSFAEDGSFELFQMIGAGRFRKFDGTWTLSGEILTGRYSDGKAWASSYSVALDGDSLTLTGGDGKEEDTYRRTSVPQSVRDSAI